MTTRNSDNRVDKYAKYNNFDTNIYFLSPHCFGQLNEGAMQMFATYTGQRTPAVLAPSVLEACQVSALASSIPDRRASSGTVRMNFVGHRTPVAFGTFTPDRQPMKSRFEGLLYREVSILAPTPRHRYSGI